MNEYLVERRDYTDKMLKQIRKDLSAVFDGRPFCVVADGSYARKEASEISDIDFYIIYDDKHFAQEAGEGQILIDEVASILKKHVPNMPSDGGAFAAICSFSEMLKNIGGENESNSSLTRRVLLLLEGDWLFNKNMFSDVRRKLIETYVTDKTSAPQIALFLLNDFIRYYRTVCVDFNYKTVEGDKAWGARNIKLVFSRKLLYFGGIVAVAETANMTADVKRKTLMDLLSLSPVGRIFKVCGPASSEALEKYARFLVEISDPITREELERVHKGQSGSSEKFRELKNLGHQFSYDLLRLLRNRYDQSHSIHRMLIL